MAVQKELIKRPMYDANGAAIGSTAALSAGVPGEFADDSVRKVHPFTLTAASAYGNYADDGIVVGPKEGVRYGGGISDGLSIAANATVSIATLGHIWVDIVNDAKAAIAKGADVYQRTDGTLTTESANKKTGSSAIGKAYSPIAYTAYQAGTPASGTPGSDGYTPAVAEVPEKGGEQFYVDASGKYHVRIVIEIK